MRPPTVLRTETAATRAKKARRFFALLLLAGVIAAPVLAGAAASLRGSRSSMDRQNRSARAHDFTFIRSPGELRRFVDLGLLSRVSGSRNFELAAVSYPYTRPEVLLFIERLSRQYRAGCGEKLVVTSLTRPKSRQPPNASSRSVHPTGMALDLRRSRSRSCRRWLESTLLYLEKQGVLEAGYEPRPPHYHVAVFPRPYKEYVEWRLSGGGRREYLVRRGDTLWKIARDNDLSVSAIKNQNSIRGDRIHPGQMLTLPE